MQNLEELKVKEQMKIAVVNAESSNQQLQRFYHVKPKNAFTEKNEKMRKDSIRRKVLPN